MKIIFISVVGGLIGAMAFFVGAASSSGGNLRILAFPALLLQHATIHWGLSLNDVQLNRWALLVQFISYFLLSFIIIKIIRQFTNNKSKQ